MRPIILLALCTLTACGCLSIAGTLVEVKDPE